MIVYLAGNWGTGYEFGTARLDLFLKHGANRLSSYAAILTYNSERYYFKELATRRTAMVNRPKLFLDSGAFSVWTKGDVINVDEYTDFVLNHLDIIEAVAVLDRIPSKPGDRNPSESERNHSAKVTMDNAQHMLKRGVPIDKLVPVHHMGEDLKYLQDMIDSGFPYVGLSPDNAANPKDKAAYLDSCMPVVCDSDGMPKVKFHGFAVTSVKTMRRYPWYSVDSASWLQIARNGSVLVPPRKGGKYRYDIAPHVVCVSALSPKKTELGEGQIQHIEHMKPHMKAQMLDYFELMGFKLGAMDVKHIEPKDHLDERGEFKYTKQAGETWLDSKAVREEKIAAGEPIPIAFPVKNGLCADYKQRDELNILYYQTFVKTLPAWPWPFDLKRSGSRFGL
jgi:hypothetical protein